MSRAKRHGPNRLSNYLEIHETVLGHLIYKGLVTEDRLELKPGGDGDLSISGELILREGVLRLQVTKLLNIVDTDDDGRVRVQTEFYSYNLSLPGVGNVFRYDSPHDGADDIHPHHGFHHRHEYQPFSSAPKHYEVTCNEKGDWPVLSEVIEEAEKWYWDNLLALAGSRS